MTNSSAGKKTILYVSGFSDIVGGGQRSFFLLLKHLDRTRFRPVVLCPGPGEVSREVLLLGCDVRFLEKPLLRTWRVWKIPDYIRKLRGIVSGSGADLIHCDTLDTAFLCGISFSGLPLVFHARVSDIGAILDKVVPFFCDRIICVSAAVAERFTGFKGKVQIIYNGVNTEDFTPEVSGKAFREKVGIPPGAPLMGYCGQLVQEKGLKVLVEAFRIVNRELPESRLVFAGRGKFEEDLKRIVVESSLEKTVVFAGFIEEIREFMAALDVFVLPTFHKEGLARVLLEAMACGKPVIATPIGGNAETIVDGVTGFIFPAGEHEQLALKIISLLKDKELAGRIGQAGRLRAVNDFSIKRTAENIHSLYSALLAGV
jgi:glycosyltransferase involved in cell wall biosynthesis